MASCIIVDDEDYSCELLSKKIKKLHRDWEILGLFTSPIHALEEIPKRKPDILFLDIQMPELNGFDVVKRLVAPIPAIIFVTAYDQFAMQALKLNALDYLLKPVDLQELQLACDRYEESKPGTTRLSPPYQQVLDNLLRPTKIILHTAKSIEYITITDIIRCESLSAYTRFYLNDGQQILVSKNIGEYEELLTPCQFFRIHTSHLINMKEVKQFLKTDGGYVRMSDQSLIEVSRRRKEEFLQEIQKLGAGF